jgi:hypothetical protein
MELAVLLQGTLRGLDLESRCELLAIRRPGTKGKSHIYKDLRILHAPAGWPEGEYILEVEGVKLRAVLRGRQWRIDQNLVPSLPAS